MPNLIPSTVLAAFPQRLRRAADINTLFTALTGKHYLNWFNDNLANRGPWTGVRLVATPANIGRFAAFWDQIPTTFGDALTGGSISVPQFCALMGIISNETGGDFVPVTEKIGRPGHPGLAYPFDRISGVKHSYNTKPDLGNETAFACFNNPFFLAAHGPLPPTSVHRTTNPVWRGEVYPQATVSTTASLAATGFIMQADFMKFRGRGLIQTTGRANYVKVIEFVQAYTGANSVIRGVQARWAGKPPARIAFETRNEDWDQLFQATNLEIACAAIRIHNRAAGNYLTLSTSADVLNGTAPGSLQRMGLRISGSAEYGKKFHGRVAAVLNAMAAIPVSPAGPLVAAGAGFAPAAAGAGGGALSFMSSGGVPAGRKTAGAAKKSSSAAKRARPVTAKRPVKKKGPVKKKAATKKSGAIKKAVAVKKTVTVKKTVAKRKAAKARRLR